MGALMAVVTAARSIRSEHDVHPGAAVPVALRTADAELAASLQAQSQLIATLVKIEGELRIDRPSAERPKGTVLAVAQEVEVLVDLRGHVDPAKDAERLERAVRKAEKDLKVLEGRLGNPAFVDKAPAEVVAEVKEQREALLRTLTRLREAIAVLAELG